LLVIAALAFCQALQADDTQSIEPAPTFEDNIGPLLAKSCYECHGEETQEAGLDLRTVSKMVFGGESGTALVPGKPAESYLWSMIESGQMPPEGCEPLSEESKSIIRRWT
jgi:hypothetical protein